MKPSLVLPWIAGFLLSAALFSHTVALRLLLLGAGLALLAAVIVRERASVQLVPPLWRVFAAWAAWSALSLMWSPEPDRAFREYRNEIIYTALVFWVCFAAAQARGAARIISTIVALGAALACSIAVYSYTRTWDHTATGWHGGPGDHSSALLMLMPCALGAAWYGLRSHWSRARLWPLAALIAFFVVAAYTTQNRTVWLGFGVELLIIIVLVRILQPASAPRLGLRASVGVVLLGVAVVAGTVAATVAVHRERATADSAKALHRDPRLALWPEVLERIEARPLTGYGFGRGGLRVELRGELGDRQLWHAHNLFLEIAVQLGLPGVVLLLALLAATLREAWRLCRQGGDLPLACGIALAALVAGMLVRNMTDMLWVRQNALLYWGIAGTLLGLGAAVRAPAAR